METAVLYLQFHDYPLWTMDEETGMRFPGLPAYMTMPEGLDEILVKLQSSYDSLFSMQGEAMGFDGIPTEEFRTELLNLSKEAEKILKQSYPTLELENRIPQLLMSCPMRKK